VKLTSSNYHTTENLIKIVIDRLLLSPQSSVSTFTQLALSQPRTSKKIIHFLLRHLSQKHLQGLSLDDTSPNDKVSAVAQLLKELALNDATRREVLINWCASSSGAGLGDGIGIRRAVVAALAQDRDAIIAVLEKSLAQFGDELYIKHSAILQQDGKNLLIH
jgi:telomere length regulation protein